MKKLITSGAAVAALVLIFAAQHPAAAQGIAPAQGASDATRAAGGPTRVVVTGDSLVQERPDTAVITVAVVTQNRSALAAQQENATKTEAVVRAVRQAAGQGAEVETSGYNLQPQYTYRENQTPLIQSYVAQNSVTVTMSDLTKVGAVIDAAAAAGANQVSGLSFTLRQDKAARQRALAEATREALSKAQTLATVLGGRVVRVVEVSEAGSVSRPVPIYKDEVMTMQARVGQAPTPVEVGSLDIRSQVTLVAEVAPER